MTSDEIAEVVSKGQMDGARLYRVADALYKIAIGFNWLFGILGIILTFVAARSGGLGPALGAFLVTLLVCAIGYAAAVFGSHGAKVIVHILFSNLVILEKGQK